VSFDLELQNRRALVTGGTKGIGAAVVSVLQGGDRLDERVMVRTGRLQVRLHMIVGRAKKGVADARVIDEQLAQAWREEGAVGHLANDFMEANVLEAHRLALTSLHRGPKALLALPQFGELGRPDMLHCQAAHGLADHRGNEKEIPQCSEMGLMALPGHEPSGATAQAPGSGRNLMTARRRVPSPAHAGNWRDWRWIASASTKQQQ
jgi:NAD(P)-dependent dehydrogenase (short-subunit alcohol dehydrogenase family)